MAGNQRRPPTGPDTPPLYVGVERQGGGARRVVGGGLPVGSGAPSPLPAGPVFTFPPDYFPPPDATDFEAQGSQAGVVPASGVVTLGSYQLPPNERGVIRSVAFGVGDFTAVSAVNFAVLINGAAAPGWGALQIFPQNATFAVFSYAPEETRIWVPANALVQVVGAVTAAGPCPISMLVHGWHWPMGV